MVRRILKNVVERKQKVFIGQAVSKSSMRNRGVEGERNRLICIQRLLEISGALLAPYIDHPFYFGVDYFIFVHQFNAEGFVKLFHTFEGGGNLIDVVLAEAKASIEGASSRFAKTHRAGLVPDNKVLAQVLNEHEHKDRIGGGKHAAAENRADVVTGAQSER